MNILVLGHLVLDEIHSSEGAVYESPGGITFSLSAFSAVAGRDDRLTPVFPYGSDAQAVFNELGRQFPEIDTSNCYLVERANTRVRLFHESAAAYNTQLVSSLDSIPFDRFSSLLEAADLVYLNMMTGADIVLEDALKLRGRGRLVYFDLHMIAYRVHADGKREAAAAADWREWVTVGDVLQCNEQELRTLCGSAADEADEAEIVRGILSGHGPGLLVVTRADRGATLFTPGGVRTDIPARTVDRVVDSTGCGDVFGSVFAHALVSGLDPHDGAEKAAVAAAFTAAIPGSDGIRGLRQHIVETNNNEEKDRL